MNLHTFLFKHQTRKEDKEPKECTHTRIGGTGINGGSYSIQGMDRDVFMEIYLNEIVLGKTRKEYLTERQITHPSYPKIMGNDIDDLTYGPVLIDFDFKYPVSITTRQHNRQIIEDIIMIYVNVIHGEFLIFNPDEGYEVYVMEKEHVNIVPDKNYTKDGIHIIMGIQMNHVMQEMVRTRVLDQIHSMIDLPLTNSWDNVIDAGICKGTTNWQLYGSQKPENEAYRITHWYKMTADEDGDIGFDLTVQLKDFDMPNSFKKLSAQYTDNVKLLYHPQIVDEYNRKINRMTTPITIKRRRPVAIAGGAGAAEDTVLGPRPFEEITTSEILQQEMDKILANLTPSQQYIRETHLYAQVLPEKYYCPGSHLLNRQVAFALKDTSPDLFLSWIMLRSKADDFEYDTIPKLFQDWNRHFVEKAEGKRVTRGSILFWAKTDAPKEYLRIKNASINTYIQNSIASSTEYDYAKVLHELKKDTYVCADSAHNIWYVYNGTRWELDKGNTLRMCISTEMFALYVDKVLEKTDLMANTEDTDKKEEIAKSLKHLNTVASNLKRTSCKNNIMREAQELFFDRYFLAKLDANPDLLGCENGIIDLDAKTFGFRAGKQSDYISKSTGIPYVPYDELDEDVMEEIRDFMRKLFPVPELCEYMWEHLASVLNGNSVNHTFNMYTGTGSNGKSILTDLMSKTLGEYKGTVPLSLITEKRSLIGGASPEVMQLKNIRYAVFQESSKGAKMNEGPLKEMTGGDPITGRALYKDSETFYPQFSLAMCTNVPLIINSNDDGTWRRMRYVPFLAKFVDDNYVRDDDEEYVFPKDKFLNKKFKKWTSVFLSMLIQKARETDCVVKDCKIVMAKSLEYRESQDNISLFLKDHVIKTKNSDDTVDKSVLLQTYKAWCEEHGIKKCLTTSEFESELINCHKFKFKKGAKWVRCMLKQGGDEEEEVA